jgi:AcrR family transcriptional regulator
VNVVLDRPPRSARKAKGSGHFRRAEILAAAEEIFLLHGYEGTTIRKIADAVGVSSTALYMHFRDKNQILVEICETEFSRLLAQNTEIAALQMDPVARVRRMLDAYMKFALDNPNAYQLVFTASHLGLEEGQLEGVSALSDRCYELFSEAVGRIADAGRLKGGVLASAQVTWAATHGLVALLIGRPNFAWEDRETLTKLMLDSLFDGLVTS